MRFAAVIFDRDHTLLAFDPQRVEAIQARIDSIAPDLPPSATLRLWNSWPGAWPQQPAEEPAFWHSFWSTLGDAHRLSAEQVAALEEAVGPLYHTIFTAYPDTLACLHALRVADVRLAVLTNFELPSVDRTLAHAGIDPELFEIALSSATLGVRKPDPQAFHAIAAAMHLPPSACLFIDDLSENVAAARSIGMEALRIDRTLVEDDLTNGVIATLTGLPRAVLPPI
jgi:putative hydrolase of the HAD superfamily